MPISKWLVLLTGVVFLSLPHGGLALQQAKKINPSKPVEEVLTNESIIQLVQAGIGEELIIAKIQKSRRRFDLSVNGMVALKEAGVSNRLLRHMMDVKRPSEELPAATPAPPAKSAAAPAATPPAKSAAAPAAPKEPPRAATTPPAGQPPPGAGAFTISGYVGASSTSAASRVDVVLYSEAEKKNIDSVQTNWMGKYTFKDVAPGTYAVKVGKISKEAVVVKRNLRLDIDLSSEDGTMDYAKAAAAAKAPSRTAQPEPVSGPNDASLMQAMAAEYYSYSGSTERKVMLCADGRYFNASESSYSGTSSDSLGNQNMAWGAASQNRGEGRWSIQGNQQQGTIMLQDGDGSQSQVRYQSTGERGCFQFNGTTFCMSGPPRCQ